MRLRGILQNEHQKKVWHGIRCVTKSTRPNGVTRTNTPQVDGIIKVCNTTTFLKEGLNSSLSQRYLGWLKAPLSVMALSLNVWGTLQIQSMCNRYTNSHVYSSTRNCNYSWQNCLHMEDNWKWGNKHRGLLRGLPVLLETIPQTHCTLIL